MRLIRQLPFVITAALTIATILLTADVNVWTVNDTEDLTDEFIESPYVEVGAAQLIAAEAPSIEVLNDEDRLPYFFVPAEGVPLAAGIAWEIVWQDETDAAELLVEMNVHREDSEEDTAIWRGLVLPLVEAERGEATVTTETMIESIEVDTPGYYIISANISAAVEGVERSENMFLEGEVIRDVITLPPITDMAATELHAPPIETDDIAMLLLDWWVWQGHPCELGAELANGEFAEFCNEIDLGDPEDLIESAYFLLDYADEADVELFAVLFHQIGLLELSEGRPEAAIEVLTESVWLHATEGDTQLTAAALHNLGIALARSEDIAPAEEAIKQAVSLRGHAPADTSLLFSTLQIHILQDDRDRALATANALNARGLPQAPRLIDWLENEF
ncbi:MAG: tetratricopeptide repeat protein [Chloroflexota bacterium]